jgi:flavodoxin
MKTLVVYTSKGGATETVAREIAKALKSDLKKAEEIGADALDKYELIGFGSGIYMGKYGKKIRKLLERYLGAGKKAFVFSTSGKGSDDYNDGFKEKLREKGFDVVGSFACKGYDDWFVLKLFGGINKGHPNKEDLKGAREFAKSLKA